IPGIGPAIAGAAALAGAAANALVPDRAPGGPPPPPAPAYRPPPPPPRPAPVISRPAPPPPPRPAPAPYRPPPSPPRPVAAAAPPPPAAPATASHMVPGGVPGASAVHQGQLFHLVPFGGGGGGRRNGQAPPVAPVGHVTAIPARWRYRLRHRQAGRADLEGLLQTTRDVELFFCVPRRRCHRPRGGHQPHRLFRFDDRR